MSRLREILASGERIDQRLREIQDINDRARAAGTHIRDQYDAAYADAVRGAHRKK